MSESRTGSKRHLEAPAGRTPEASRAGRSVAVLSGKGGVGKTSLAVNLALTLAERGERVLLVDADFALGTADLLLQIEPHRNLAAYFDGNAALSDLLAVGPLGLAVLPAPCGRSDLAFPGADLAARFQEDLASLGRRFDWTVVDLPAGLGAAHLDLAGGMEQILLVTAPEPAALLHAYAAAKQLAGRGRGFRLVVNRVRSDAEAAGIARRFTRTASCHLGAAPSAWSAVPEDPAVPRAAEDRIPFVVAAPHAPVSIRVREIALRLAADGSPSGGARHRGGKDPVLSLAAA